MKMLRADFLTLLGTSAILAGLGGCDAVDKASDDDGKKTKKKKSDDDDDDDKKKSSKKKAGASKKKPKDSKKKAKSADKRGGEDDDGKGPDLNAILGTKADGFSPKVFKKLKEDMSPKQAAKVMVGADKLDEFGFAEIPATDNPGVQKYKLSYLDNKLAFAEIIFDESVSTDAFWDRLVAHLKEKLDPVEMSDLEPGKKHVMWIRIGLGSISVTEGIVDPGFTLQYAVSP